MAGILALMILGATGAPAEGKAQVIEHYALQVPAGYVLADVSPKLMDFKLYALTESRSGVVMCTLYVGNHPRFPRFQWSGKPVQSSAANGTRKEYRSADRIEGLMTFDGLTYRGALPSPFGLIHYFADRIGSADVKLVAALMDSVTVTKKDLEAERSAP